VAALHRLRLLARSWPQASPHVVRRDHVISERASRKVFRRERISPSPTRQEDYETLISVFRISAPQARPRAWLVSDSRTRKRWSNQFHCREVYVYAMGPAPWLNYVEDGEVHGHIQAHVDRIAGSKIAKPGNQCRSGSLGKRKSVLPQLRPAELAASAMTITVSWPRNKLRRKADASVRSVGGARSRLSPGENALLSLSNK